MSLVPFQKADWPNINKLALRMRFLYSEKNQCSQPVPLVRMALKRKELAELHIDWSDQSEQGCDIRWLAKLEVDHIADLCTQTVTQLSTASSGSAVCESGVLEEEVWEECELANALGMMFIGCS